MVNMCQRRKVVHNSQAYDYGYNRSVSTNSPNCTLSDDKKTQLLDSFSSLESRIEFVCNITSSHIANCVKCKTPKAKKVIEIMADSGASGCFTHTKSDLSEFEVLDDKDLVVKTASKTNSLRITGRGAIMITHKITHKGKSRSVTTQLYPVYYLPGLLTRLISIGQLLNSGLELRGSSSLLSFTATACNSIWPMMQCKPHSLGQNLHWLSARLTSKHSLLALSLVHTIDYDIMHRRFAHPSKDVL